MHVIWVAVGACDMRARTYACICICVCAPAYMNAYTYSLAPACYYVVFRNQCILPSRGRVVHEVRAVGLNEL